MKRILLTCLACLCIAGCAFEELPETQIVKAPASAPTQAQTLPPAEEATVVPTESLADDDLVRVADHIPGIRQNLRYATVDNFTGQQIYDFADAYLRYGTVKKLQKVCAELEQQNLSILIWDGFRPLSAQEKLWEICPDPAYVSHPVTGSRSHCRGSAIDLTLVDLKTGEQLVMPTGFDDFSVLADRDYSDCGAEAAANARLLEDIMVEHGFKPYSAEWWHYADTDDYPVEETFKPEQTVFDGGIG